MEVAEILATKPKGTKLYSPIFGNVLFDEVNYKYEIISVMLPNQDMINFLLDGRYSPKGECMLFPSRELRDWQKFSWKKGDVLGTPDGKYECLFEMFTDEQYKTFNGKYFLATNNDGNTEYLGDIDFLRTSSYTIEKEDASRCYINTIEEKLGGKLNLDTLEVESLKEGDIYTTDGKIKTTIGIFKNLGRSTAGKYIANYAHLFVQISEVSINEDDYLDGSNYRAATEEEKQLLFDALEKEGKKWNANTKQIEDTKSKYKFKPFAKVVARYNQNSMWRADIFSSKQGESYFCIGGACYQCLPYNEETAHLIGTFDDYE